MTRHGPYTLEQITRAPWKNGRGVTQTLACYPEAASLDNFAWRLSLAHISESSDFSAFPGVDRTIMLWSGGGVMLQSDDGIDHALDEQYRPFLFAGETAVTCELLDGPTMDLNLMLRRGVAQGRMVASREAVHLNESMQDLLVICAEGLLRVEIVGEAAIEVNAGSFLHWKSPAANVQLKPQTATSLVVYVAIECVSIN